ncbi:SfnB family sulfur acquisition oxidoreductase [uncultured Acinetobacter sp.]|uniref:SfnB family sulfur acquisition oxidoreductase n=1 Tax=uncultured Acinetobacter sp. TaxID=165433 RepID=UPI0026219ED1|nr:SfnB family sulfur acquisition oxidoreductase [uncultured Acinetobacter sp.]
MTSYQAIDTKKVHAHVIQSDQEALDIAKALAAQFKHGAIERDAKRIFPFEQIEAYSQSGLWAITVPKAYGGAQVSSFTVAQVIALMSGVDGSIGQIPQNHFYALEVLRNTGSEAQKQRLYQEVLHGARFGNALAEFKPKNSSIKQTTLQPHHQGFLINGEKFYCTGSLFAHRIPTLVKDKQQREFLAFIPSNSEGLSLIDDWSGFGQRTTGSGTVKFDHVYVHQDDVIAFDQAFTQPTLVGPFAQIMHAAIEVGIARAAFEETLVRVHQARPWIDANVDAATQDPLTIYEVGRIAVDVRASELLLKQASDAIDAAYAAPNADNVAQASIQVAKVRAHSSETALKAASKLIELAGSRGSQRQDGLDRFWRNARVHTLHDAARWKYYFIGKFALNGTRPPRRGTL